MLVKQISAQEGEIRRLEKSLLAKKGALSKSKTGFNQKKPPAKRPDDDQSEEEKETDDDRRSPTVTKENLGATTLGGSLSNKVADRVKQALDDFEDAASHGAALRPADSFSK